MRNSAACALAALLAGAGPAVGQNLFEVTATGGGNPATTAGSDNLLDLVDDAVNTQGAFAPFASSDANFALDYGGVPGAIVITKDSSNTQATLTFGPTGVTRTFTGANQADLENQIEDYLKKDGGQDLADFYKAINALTAIGVSDGNPNATTARMAQFTFDRFAMYGDQTKAFVLYAQPSVDQPPPPPPADPLQGRQGDGEPPADPVMATERRKAGAQLHVFGAAHAFETGDFDGTSLTLGTSLDANITQRVGISLGSFFAYNSVQDADVFHLAFIAGLPLRLALPTDNSALTWQVTPFFNIGGSGSEDIGAGGLVLGGGLANMVSWELTRRWTLTMANQYSFYEGEKLSFDDFDIDPGVSQSMLKNGVRATYRMNDNWYVYGGAAYTNFLDDAAIDGWISPAAGVGYSTFAGTSIQAGFSGDFGDDWTSYGGRLALHLAF